MKTIKVVAAIIIEDGKVFAVQRGYGKWKDWWEFPGGKIEEGESPEAALAREIKEELDAQISIGRLFCKVEYDYPDFHLSMLCYLCSFSGRSPKLLEHENSAMLSKENLFSVRWLPADEQIIKDLEKALP